jgi:hypothetical protein
MVPVYGLVDLSSATKGDSVVTDAYQEGLPWE